MKKNPQKNKQKTVLQGKYVCSLSEETIKRAQLNRMFLCIATTALLLLPWLFLKPEYLKVLYDKKVTSISSLLLIIYFFNACFSIFSLVTSFFTRKLTKEVTVSKMPRLDVNKHTWSALEWQFYLACIYSIITVALTIYHFDIFALLLALTTVGGAICAYFVKRISFKCYANNMTFISLDDELTKVKHDLDEEEKYKPKHDLGEPTNLPRFKNTEENEDFYDER